MPDLDVTSTLLEKIQRLRDYSGERFARPKAAIAQTVPDIQNYESKIMQWTE